MHATDEVTSDQTVSVSPIDRLRGEMSVPGDKSVSHRAAMFAALASGRSTIANFSSAADCQATLDCVAALGANVNQQGTNVEVESAGELRQPSRTLDAVNSGTTMRLLSGILAAQPFETTITGDDSLRSRPMRRVAVPLRLMGAEVETREDGCAPLRIRGRRPLRAVDYTLPVASAQIKSAVLLAGLGAEGRTSVTEPARTRDHTERMMRHFGVEVRREGDTISIDGPAELTARELRVPGDISSASFFVAAAAMLPGSDLKIRGVGLNPTRTAFLTVLQRMGVDLTITEEAMQCGEATGTLHVRGAASHAGQSSRALEVSGDLIPNLIDELPLLAVVAAGTNCELEVRDAAELRVKESDRIAATAENLRRMGARVEVRDDGWRVYGAERLRAARLSSFGDHRIAMAGAVAALGAAGGDSHIEDAKSAVAVSLPEFWTLLKDVAE